MNPVGMSMVFDPAGSAARLIVATLDDTTRTLESFRPARTPIRRLVTHEGRNGAWQALDNAATSLEGLHRSTSGAVDGVIGQQLLEVAERLAQFRNSVGKLPSYRVDQGNTIVLNRGNGKRVVDTLETAARGVRILRNAVVG